MHLTLAMMPWFASSAVSRLSNDELQALKQVTLAQSQQPNAGEFPKLWQKLLNEPEFAKAAEAESKNRVTEFLEGLVRYQETPYARDVEEFPCVYARGSARLLDCGGEEGRSCILLVPSLINKYYALDLTRKQSIARYLKREGFRVFIVDWGTPSKVEAGYNCGLYASEHLSPMAEWIKQTHKTQLIAAGYCMGGLLTLALACARPDLIHALALIATPWDFSVADFPKVALPPQELAAVHGYIATHETLSAEAIHTLFHLVNPYAFQTRLREFATMKTDSPAMEDFLSMEHWVQDGVPMARGVAQDCLIEWSQKNTTMNLQWRACGRVVNPATLKMPVFIAAPRDDKIVPSACALPLARLCKNSTLIEPVSGHVGMIVGRSRRMALWEPLSEWLTRQVA